MLTVNTSLKLWKEYQYSKTIVKLWRYQQDDSLLFFGKSMHARVWEKAFWRQSFHVIILRSEKYLWNSPAKFIQFLICGNLVANKTCFCTILFHQGHLSIENSTISMNLLWYLRLYGNFCTFVIQYNINLDSWLHHGISRYCGVPFDTYLLLNLWWTDKMFWYSLWTADLSTVIVTYISVVTRIYRISLAISLFVKCDIPNPPRQ